MMKVSFPPTFIGKPLFEIHAGPIFNCPGDDINCISLAAEIGNPRFWDHLKIEDFGVPEDTTEVYRVLKRIIYAMAKGDSVYIGCRGGIGRTGMVLALLYKVLDPEPCMGPIAWVRSHYLRNAVETFEQSDFIKEFDVAPLRNSVRLAKVVAGLRVWFGI